VHHPEYLARDSVGARGFVLAARPLDRRVNFRNRERDYWIRRDQRAVRSRLVFREQGIDDRLQLRVSHRGHWWGALSLRITSLYGLSNGSASTEEMSSFQQVFLLRRMAIFNCLLASRYAPLVKASSGSARSSSNSWVWRHRSLDTRAVILVIRRLVLVQSTRRASMSTFHK